MEKELSEISAEEFYEPMVQPDLNELVFHKIPFDSEKIKDNYQKKMFIKTLTSGKNTTRKGLGKRLLNLAGFYINLPDTALRKCVKGEFDGSIQFIIRPPPNMYYVAKTKHKPVDFYLLNPKFKKICDIFLKNYYVELVTDELAYVIFERKYINWGILDQALAVTLPRNIQKDKNGFVYVAASWSKLNSLHEQKKSFIDYV